MQDIISNYFKYKKPVFEQLIKFGFARSDGGYEYSVGIAEGQLRLTVFVGDMGETVARVTDSESGDEYVLHRMSGAVGSFVGMVRTDCDAVLTQISESCFEADVFRFSQTKEIIDYVRREYGDELEYLWQKFPDNAVWRRKDNRKWYAAVLTVSAQKLGRGEDESLEIIDLRIRPDELDALLDGRKYLPGYHMNKKHWYTMILDGSVPTEEICRRIAESRALALKK